MRAGLSQDVSPSWMSSGTRSTHFAVCALASWSCTLSVCRLALVGVSREPLCRFWNPLSLEPPPSWYSASHVPGSFPKLQPPPSYLCGTCSLRSGPRAGGQGSGLTHLVFYPQRWPSLLLVFLYLRTVLSCVLSSFLVVYVRQESKLCGSHSLRARSRSLCNAFHKVKRIKLVLPRKSERRIQGEDPFPMW